MTDENRLPPSPVVTTLLWSTLITALIIMLYSFGHRNVQGDTAWLAEQAYWLSQDGVPRSELFRGYNEFENRLWFYHMLFIIQGALVTNLFGWSLATYQLVSFIYLLMLSAAIVIYFMAVNKGEKNHSILVFLVLLTANTLVSRYSFEFRPEIMLSFLGFTSFMFLQLSPTIEVRTWILLSALFAGLAALTHLNGVIYMGAGLVYVLVRFGFASAVVFSIISTSIFSLYLADSLINGSVFDLIDHFHTDPALESSHIGFVHYAQNILTETKRYFRTEVSGGLSLLLITALIVMWRKIRDNARLNGILIYLAVCAFLMALLAHSKTEKYLLLILPFELLLITDVMMNSHLLTTTRRRVFLFFFSFYMVANLYGTVDFIRDAGNGKTIESINSAVVEELALTEKDHVVAPLLFAFGAIEQTNVQSLYVYRILERRGNTSLSNFFEDAKKMDRNVLILDERFMEDINLQSPEQEELFGEYYFWGTSGPYWVFMWERSL